MVGRCCPRSLIARLVPARIAEVVAEVLTVPVGLRYEFLKNEKPACLVRIGEPVVLFGEDHSRFTRRLELHLDTELAALDAEIVQELAR